MQRHGLFNAITNWENNIHGFFNLLALEIWGRLFFLDQPVEIVTEQILRRSHRPKGESRATQAT
jgi:hypothetical protein